MSLSDEELSALYGRYAHVLYHRCRSILGNDEDARDAVQETFAKVLRNGDEFRRQSSPLTWMYAISTNHALNQLRNRKGRADKHVAHREDIAGEGIERPDDEASDRAWIVSLLGDADEETRAVIVHTYFDDCTREEVASLVGISVPTVRKRLNAFLDRARRRLGAVALTGTALVAVLLGGAP